MTGTEYCGVSFYYSMSTLYIFIEKCLGEIKLLMSIQQDKE